MKKLFFIIISALFFTACSDSFLELENKNTLATSSFLLNEADLKLAVNATYTPIGHFGMFGLHYFKKFNELDPYIIDEAHNLDRMIFGVNEFRDTWDALYVGLYRTSDILYNMNMKLKTVVDPTVYAQSEAQVKAMRGLYYFYLVTLFNTPIYYDENSVPNDAQLPLASGTQEQFWNKLESDLTFAAANLPAVWADSKMDLGRITKGAANAQLGKALLYKHYHYYMRLGLGSSPEAKANLLKAKNALSAVMTGGKYALIMPKAESKKDYQAALLSSFTWMDIKVGANTYKSENNDESVWEIQYNSDTRGATSQGYLPLWQSGGSNLAMYFSPTGSYKNQFADNSLWYKFESLGAPVGYTYDPRAYATCFIDGDTLDWSSDPTMKLTTFSTDAHISKKAIAYNTYIKTLTNVQTKAFGLKKYYYTQYTANNSTPNNIRLIRYSDVLLMYAEVCYQYDADADGAGLIALNRVRDRVGMPEKLAITPSVIMDERTFEFATEAHRYNDLIRWSFDPAFISTSDLNSLFGGNFILPKHLYLPIPQGEIDVNQGKLKQNAGW